MRPHLEWVRGKESDILLLFLPNGIAVLFLSCGAIWLHVGSILLDLSKNLKIMPFLPVFLLFEDFVDTVLPGLSHGPPWYSWGKIKGYWELKFCICRTKIYQFLLWKLLWSFKLNLMRFLWGAPLLFFFKFNDTLYPRHRSSNFDMVPLPQHRDRGLDTPLTKTIKFRSSFEIALPL